MKDYESYICLEKNFLDDNESSEYFDCDKWRSSGGVLMMREAVPGGRGPMETSMPSAQYCWEPKTAVKNQVFNKAKNIQSRAVQYRGPQPGVATGHG